MMDKVDERVQTGAVSRGFIESLGQPYCREGAAAELVQDSIKPWGARHHITEANGMKTSCSISFNVLHISGCILVQTKLSKGERF
jgi:hypothetical protein